MPPIGIAIMGVVFWFTTTDDPVLRARRERGEKPTSAWLELEPLKNVQVWRFALYYFFVFGAFVALSLWLPQYLINVYGVDVKTAKTGLHEQVDRIVDAFEVGYLKMRPEYWPACQRLVGFDPARSLYVDDDEGCLRAAHAYGIRHIVHSAKSSSQLPPEASTSFRSVERMTALLTGPASSPVR